MSVAFLDLTRQNREILDEALAAVREAILNSAFIGGPAVSAFESNFAAFCGAPHGVAVNSGTDALRLAILALGVEPGDEIVTVPFTFIATAEVITQCGCRPVFADIEPVHYGLDPAKLEAALTPRTRGIVPVHLYGHPADMGPILEIARKHGLWLLEDACQAHGAALDGRVAGSLGDAAAFSFYPTKNMGAFGEGGFITARDEAVAHKCLALRNHGQSARYSHEFEGYNARLDAIQAAFLDAKLKRLPDWNAARAHIAGRYLGELEGVGDLVLPKTAPGATHVYHQFVVRTARRDALRQHLAGLGIGTAVHYPLPLHLQKAYAHLGYAEGAFPVSEACAREVMSLPMYQGLADEEATEVITAVRGFFRP
ncbi:MAG: DegT/DnrJ/EryC1/StrS family aminotransferase [Acidobacteria bacterium]|nr:DegT/DnrJ/EryC1/StrS family aminotransferase [Acidobacteriota bacterium]